jgi:D-amino peptidase
MTSRSSRARVLATLLAALCLQGRPAAGGKVYISADMEGVAGAVTSDQLGPEGFEYARFREFMTAEVLAAMEGARQAGATEFVVSDSHGNGQNLLIERFPADVTVVRSWPRPLMMMEGIDASFAAVVFIGYHTAATNPEGVRAHTISSATFASVALNGRPVSEAGLNAAIAGHFGVPVVLVSGDDATVTEARELLGEVEVAPVKRAITFHAAATRTPEAAQELIRTRARAALGRLADFRPHRVAAPVTLELVFKNYRPAEMLSLLPVVQRTAARTIRFTGKDILEVARFLEFVREYRADLSP